MKCARSQYRRGEDNPGRDYFFITPLLHCCDRARLMASASSCTLHRLVFSLFLPLPLFFFLSASSSSSSSSRCTSRERVVILHARSPLLLHLRLLSDPAHSRAPQKKRKEKKKKKTGGVGGLPPTFKLFSPLSPTTRQKHSHTETRRPGIVALLLLLLLSSPSSSFVLIRDSARLIASRGPARQIGFSSPSLSFFLLFNLQLSKKRKAKKRQLPGKPGSSRR